MSTTLDRRREHITSLFPEWTERSLGTWLTFCAQNYADRPLVITDGRTVTYAEVDAWATRLADGLIALGLKPGEHVGIVMANYAEFVPVKFAVARAGGVAVPMNFLYREEELKYVLGQSECRILISMTAYADLDYMQMLDNIAPGWEQGSISADLPLLRDVILFSTDGRTRTGARTIEDLDNLGRENSGSAAELEIDPRSLADILYTSGTTGSPKGVMIAHDAAQRTGYASALTRAFEDGWRVLFSLPCYHMFGYIEGLMATMVVGGAVILQPRFDPAEYLRGIEEHRATDILCVPTMTVAILEHPDVRKYDLSSLKAVLSGAAPGPIWLWEKVAKELGASEIVTGYGMTECGGAMTLSLPDDPYEITSTTVGQAKWAGVAGVPDHDGALTVYRTVDPLTGDFLPDGEEGELVSQGPTNMLGFWKKPEETAHGLRDNWVFSGDLGRVRPDGYIEITGRSKELYKSGGELVMPKEIEELLTAHPDISQAYAIGLLDERWGEIGCACVVRAPGATITEEDVIAYCKNKLARFKVPKVVWFLEPGELPTTPTGKIQKFRLVQQATKERISDRLEQKS